MKEIYLLVVKCVCYTIYYKALIITHSNIFYSKQNTN